MATPFQLAGELHNLVHHPSPVEHIAESEEGGPFIVGDVAAVAAWSGLNRKGRWKVRVLGAISEVPMLWNSVRPFKYHPSHAEALAHYTEVRAHLLNSLGGSTIVPHPTAANGNSPGAQVELVNNAEGQAISVLLRDIEADYDYAVNMTPGLGALNAGGHDGPSVISWNPPPSATTVAIRSSARGIDHLLIAFNPGGSDQRAFIANGMLGAARDTQLRDVTVEVPSGLLVAQWARASGQSTLAAFGADPGPALLSRLGQSPGSPLNVSDGDLAARIGGPVAWVMRVNPGTWRAQVWFAETKDGAGISALVLSRQGAGNFQMLLGGGAGGRVIKGLTLERYAELCVARDAIIAPTATGPGGSVGNAVMGAMGGGSVPALTKLAKEYGLPPEPNQGMLCRVNEWEQLIQSSPMLSAEYAAYYGVAHGRRSGVEVDPTALFAQAIANHEAIANNAKAHQNDAALTREGHFALFEAARTLNPAQTLEFARTVAYAHLKPDQVPWAMGRALGELCLHESEPIRIQSPRQVCPSFLAALWEATPPKEREGALAKFVKNETANVEDAYGIKAPSLLDRL